MGLAGVWVYPNVSAGVHWRDKVGQIVRFVNNEVDKLSGLGQIVRYHYQK